MNTECHLSAYSNATCFSCWIPHVPAQMKWWWMRLPSAAICIAHYAARLEPCARMGMGNWTRPGASSMQLPSLGRRSNSVDWSHCGMCCYQLCFNVNWEIEDLKATSTRRRVWLVWSMCAFMWSNTQHWPQLWGGLCEQRGFGVDHELCQGLAVDYNARYPSVLNKRMSRIKRQCSLVCCHLGFTSHIRDTQKAQEPQTWWTNVLIPQLQQDTLISTETLHWSNSLAAAEGDDAAFISPTVCMW